MKKLVKYMIAANMGCFAFIGIISAFDIIKVSAAGYSDVENKLVFHYDGDKTAFNHMWIWPKSGNGNWYAWEGTDDKGFAYTTFDYTTSATKEFGFLVVKGEWAAKDTDADRYVNLDELTLDAKSNYHVYLVQGDSEVYTNPGVVQPKFYSLQITKDKTGNYVLYCKTNTEWKDLTLYKGETPILTSLTLDTDPNVSVSGMELSYNLGTEFPDLAMPYKMEMTFDVEQEDSSVIEVSVDAIANTSTLYSEKEFADNYTYTGELGAIYTKASTTFKVWTPISSSVKLRIYENGTPTDVSDSLGDDTNTEYDMTLGEKGVFSTTVEGDLDGKYYTYVVTNPSFKNREIVDPYAKSTGVNGRRGMIVNFDKINEELNWDSVSINEYKSTNLTVYETHIGDLTSSTTWGGPEELSKTYKGFYLEGTTYTEKDTTVKTGFDHIKDLGVNAVQIIPIFDSDNDEINRSFNWGYNPLNYNSLDGSYSTNPYDGYEKIREFKELVKAYNEAGINIIMDVVYNHVMAASGSNFDVLMPGYYSRYNADGSLSNGSGCGNETASNMPMFRKFMIDSTEFWAKEYKLGGFRFDLMGLHDVATMNELSENLHDNVNEYIAVYGEPWAGGTPAYDTSKLAYQDNILKYTEYGCFNDKIRDSLIKGGLSSDGAKGWITAGTKYVANSAVRSQDAFEKVIAKIKLYTRDGLNYNEVKLEDGYQAGTVYYQLQSEGASKADMTELQNGIAGFVQDYPRYLAATVTADNFAEKVAAGIYVEDGDYYKKVTSNDTFDANANYFIRKASNEPWQALTYVTCHDNYTLVDRISAAGIVGNKTIGQMAVLANSVVFTSQGISFMLAGEEFLRTKGGDKNSYSSSYEVNELNYALKIKNAKVFETYQKLIAIKQNANLFGYNTQEECEAFRNTIQISSDYSMVSYKMRYEDGDDLLEYYIIHVNGIGNAEDHVVNLAGYTLYLDTLNTGAELTDNYQLQSYQTIIAYRKIDQTIGDFTPAEAKNGVVVSNVFAKAKDGNATATFNVGTTKIEFNNAAVNEIAGKDVTLTVKVNETEVAGAAYVVELSLSGSTFANGASTVSFDYNEGSPDGKVAKLYYINDNGEKVDMNATFANGKVTFTTTHFSTFAVFYDSLPSTGLSAGAIVGIVLGSVALVALAGFCVYYFFFRKRNA
jgi:LPXTG-motif cell wall-anchored protein